MRLAPSHDRSTFNCGSSASWVAVTRSAVRSAGLERVGSLIFIPPIHGGSLSKENAYGLTFGYRLNFKQATLMAMWSDTGGAVAYGDLSLRNDKLTFNHHRVAMSAEPKYRQEWLQGAAARGCSVAELRREIRQAKIAIYWSMAKPARASALKNIEVTTVRSDRATVRARLSAFADP